MRRIVFDRTRVESLEDERKKTFCDVFGIAEKSENIQAWTAHAMTGKASPQEMQLLNAFLSQHGVSPEEYLDCPHFD
ncbi:MAG: hypothetical protein IJI56_02310 [Firmicutes bacterium]|nr:hypothetical protein [Bacillota bacterium]